MVVAEVVVFVAGVVIVVATLLSAVRTVAVPRAEQVVFGRVIFGLMAQLFRAIERVVRSPDRREALRARYAPISMLLMPFMWATVVVLGFSGMFWALGVRPYRDAFVLSGSSITTLGFRSTDSFIELCLAIVEALIGLGLIALLLSFMPALYSAFAQREHLVSRFEVRAGRPPTPVGLIVRAHRIDWLSNLGETWGHWERWFIDVGESHTTYPALSFFRSPTPERSWLAAAGTVLDSAALTLSAVAIPPSPEASLCLRSGYLALNELADFFGVIIDPEPARGDPISFRREDFDAVCEALEREGVPLVADRDRAWLDFAGWRVNYDLALIGLAELVDNPHLVLSRRAIDMRDVQHNVIGPPGADAA